MWITNDFFFIFVVIGVVVRAVEVCYFCVDCLFLIRGSWIVCFVLFDGMKRSQVVCLYSCENANKLSLFVLVCIILEFNFVFLK